MEKFIKKVSLKLIEFMLPWVATVITALPYSDSRSRFLDRLITMVEE